MTTSARLPRDTGFIEIADRVWLARSSWYDVNVTAIQGERGLVVVDTHASEDAARELVDDLRRQIGAEVVAVVNTHEHFDHFLGNIVFAETWPSARLIAHEDAVPVMAEFTRTHPDREAIGDMPRGDELIRTRPLPAKETFSSVTTIDLGDRAVELLHPGRGHTGGDIVAVTDGVVLTGDLIEESQDRDGVPGFGDDCFPLEWPATLDVVLNVIGSDTIVVPGHGDPVDRDFVLVQRSDIGVVAETIADLAGRGVPVEEALASASWPFPENELAAAVRRGYEQLPRSARRLPLV